MRKSLSRGAGVIAGATALIMAFGMGSASAVNELNGAVYGDAKANIDSYGGKITIRTREGSYLPTEKCIIANSKKASDGGWIVDLNCNDTYAGTTGHPGNSASSEGGQRALRYKKSAERLSKSYAYLVEQGDTSAFYCNEHLADCAKICEDSKACSPELAEYLGV